MIIAFCVLRFTFPSIGERNFRISPDMFPVRWYADSAQGLQENFFLSAISAFTAESILLSVVRATMAVSSILDSSNSLGVIVLTFFICLPFALVMGGKAPRLIRWSIGQAILAWHCRRLIGRASVCPYNKYLHTQTRR